MDPIINFCNSETQYKSLNCVASLGRAGLAYLIGNQIISRTPYKAVAAFGYALATELIACQITLFANPPLNTQYNRLETLIKKTAFRQKNIWPRSSITIGASALATLYSVQALRHAFPNLAQSWMPVAGYGALTLWNATVTASSLYNHIKFLLHPSQEIPN